MTIRSNHYDAAFEEYLRSRRAAYVAVDETRRALAGDDSLKSLDFIVNAAAPAAAHEQGGVANLLVDVKGRRFGGAAGRWENWITRDDVESMQRWEAAFGPHFRATLVFAYALDDTLAARLQPLTAGDAPPLIAGPLPDELCDYSLFPHDGRRYVFAAAYLDEYAAQLRPRSPRWHTLSVPRADFRALQFPFDRLLPPHDDE